MKEILLGLYLQTGFNVGFFLFELSNFFALHNGGRTKRHSSHQQFTGFMQHQMQISKARGEKLAAMLQSGFGSDSTLPGSTGVNPHIPSPALSSSHVEDPYCLSSTILTDFVSAKEALLD